MRLILLLLALFATPLLAETPAAVDFDLTVQGRVEIGPDGKVLSHELNKDAGKGVAELIAQNVALWRFEPITKNGKPVIAKTRMTLKVSAREGADGTYSLRLVNVWFGGSKTKPNQTQRQPRYPTSAISARLGARVWLALELSPEGKVLAALPYQTSLTRRMNDKKAAKWRKRFEDATLAATLHWSFEPEEYFDGAEAARFVETTVTFSIDGDPRGRQGWHAYVPGPVNPSPLFDASAILAKQAADLPEDLVLPLTSPFKLLSGAPESL